MNEFAALEVIGGPMDGLRTLLDKKGTIGRKVGNSLSLALDDEVSGKHLEIVKEGHDWCARDLNSTNGTLYMGEKLKAGRSYPLKMDDILLVGSTVLLVMAGKEGEESIPFTDFSFNDPRTCYAMTPGLGHVWNRLYSAVEEDQTVNRHFCDIDRLFVAMIDSATEVNDAGYECVGQVTGTGRYQILAKWLQSAPNETSFIGQYGGLTVAARVWKVMNLAAERKNGAAIGIGDILGAILEEGGSLAARYMRVDRQFMEDFGPKLRRGASDRTVIDIVRSCRRVSAAPPGLQLCSLDPLQPGQMPAAGMIPQPIVPPVQVETWKGFGQRLERLVTGFLADAIHPTASFHDFRPPGLEQTIEELLTAGAADHAQLEQHIKQHLDTLYNLLVVILASQHDGYRLFADTLCTMLENSVSEKKDGRSLLALGKKSIDLEELVTTIKKVRQKVETDGIGEDIVRDIIRKKIQQLGR